MLCVGLVAVGFLEALHRAQPQPITHADALATVYGAAGAEKKTPPLYSPLSLPRSGASLVTSTSAAAAWRSSQGSLAAADAGAGARRREPRLTVRRCG